MVDYIFICKIEFYIKFLIYDYKLNFLKIVIYVLM